MTYSQGGKIDARDYNGFVLGYNGVIDSIRSFWGNGFPAYGQFGYGQSAISTVAAGSTVTATQWATMINALNNARLHQTGNATAFSSAGMTAGSKINYIGDFYNTIITTFYAGPSFASQGITTTGSNFTTAISSTTGINSYIDRTVTFSSIDQVRFFFNCGGQLNLVLSTSSSNGSGSSSSFGRIITGLGGVGLINTTNSGRTGTGITLNTNDTSIGYYDMVYNTNTVIVAVTDTTAAYTASVGSIGIYASDSTTTNDSKGVTVVFRISYNIPDKTWDDTLSITLNSRVDIVYPETTYLTSSWGGAITIT